MSVQLSVYLSPFGKRSRIRNTDTRSFSGAMSRPGVERFQQKMCQMRMNTVNV